MQIIRIKLKIKVLFFIYIMVFNNLLNAKISTDVWMRLDSQTQEKCLAVKYLHIPLEETPNKQEQKKLKLCDPDAFYYGINKTADYKMARLCAIATRTNYILAMLYANGYGGKKNVELAKHFVCLVQGSPIEIFQRLKDLDTIKKNEKHQEFEMCDYASSHDQTLRCSYLFATLSTAKQNEWFKRLMKNLTSKELLFLDKLKKANAEYIQMHLNYEMNRFWMNAETFNSYEEMRLNGDFIRLLKKTISCQFVSFNKEKYTKLDLELNLLYRNLQKNASESYSIQELKKTEQSWVRYKMLWEQLAHMRCPQINQDAWGIILTAQRIQQLKQIPLKYVDGIKN